MGNKYDEQVPIPATEPRRLHPIEERTVNLLLGMAAGGVIALGIAMLTEVPLDQAWRYLVLGVLPAPAVLLIRSITPFVVETVETVTRWDWNKDGAVGRPHPVLVNPNLGQAEARRLTEAEYRAEVEAFVMGCSTDAKSQSNSQRAWAKRGVPADDYKAYRGLLIRQGWAAWNGTDEHQGWRLLREPEQIIPFLWATRAR